MAETQANKLRARTRDALGPKVRCLCSVCVEVGGRHRWYIVQSLSSLSTRSDRHPRL